MIYKKEKKGNVTIYYVRKDFEDTKIPSIMNKKLKRSDIKDIIKDNADVYTEDGKLLARFRKDKLKKQNITAFYDNVIDFAQTETNNRGTGSGSKIKDNYNNPKIMTNIIGYFDRLAPKQKFNMKQNGRKSTISVRETRFLIQYPDKFKKIIPLIQEIDENYKRLVPENYKQQHKKAMQTPFRIANTSYTTVTTNVNFQTTVHTDKGDDSDGFGNITVIEYGKYKGGETCFPQYGIGIDVRTGDIAFMDVHQPHANLPIEVETKGAKRLSIVCYLRMGIWRQTNGKSRDFMEKHLKTMRNITISKGAKEKAKAKRKTRKNRK